MRASDAGRAIRRADGRPRPRGQRHIDACVYQYFRIVRIGEFENPLGQIEQFPRGEIFFADLDPFDARGQIAGDAVEQGGAGRQSAAIRDVTPDVTREHALSV